MIKQKLQNLKSNQIFLIGLVIHFIINLISSGMIGLHYDEAYYWMYAQHPALGYFDHPPMVAWLIMAGEFLFNGEFGVRFITVVISSLSICLLWEMAKTYKENAVLFWAMVYSVILIHPYSIVATPDAPLFFATALFFYMFKLYAENQSYKNALLVAVAIAVMLYSKYHGVLVIGFAVLANLKLVGRKTFWFTVLMSVILLIPHLNWQFVNGFPTIQYHLVDSHKTVYDPMETLNYILSELAVTGPLLGWLFLFAMAKVKPVGEWERALKLVGVGTFVFFLFATLGGDFEAHWTLIAFVPLILLSYKFIVENDKWQKWVKIAGLVNFSLLLILRIALVTPLADKVKALSLFSGYDKAAEEMKAYVGDYPVVFQDTWNRAARYAFYANDPDVANLNSASYRHNQYDLYDIEEKFSGKTVYLITWSKSQFENPEIFKTSKNTWYAKKMDNFYSYYNLKFDIAAQHVENDSVELKIEIQNPYDYEIRLGDSYGVDASFEIRSRRGRDPFSKSLIVDLIIKPQSMAIYECSFPLSDITINEPYLELQIGELFAISHKVFLELE